MNYWRGSLVGENRGPLWRPRVEEEERRGKDKKIERERRKRRKG